MLLFPGYANSEGAAGYFYLDISSLKSGVHTIQWTAEDDGGNVDGIGSRYFSLLNSSNTSGLRGRGQGQGGLPPGLSASYFLQKNIGRNEPVTVLKGFSKNRRFQKIYPGHNGIITVVLHELEQVEVHLPRRPGVLISRSEHSDFPTCTWRGFQALGDQLRFLPIGSHLDIEKGIFYWQTGPGFLGNYQLVFIETDQQGNERAMNIIIKIRPTAPPSPFRACFLNHLFRFPTGVCPAPNGNEFKKKPFGIGSGAEGIMKKWE